MFKSDLRGKETEIATLRDSILSRSAGRQALLDKRRFEAVEKVWTAVNDLGKLKGLSGSMAIVKFDFMATRASDPKMQEFLSIMGADAPSDEEAQKNVALNEQPFLPELAWAYFGAYSTILRSNWLRYKILRIRLDDAGKYIDDDAIKPLLKAALPHQEKWIESNEPTSYHHLLDELEGLLLSELRSVLEGKEADRKATTRAKEIMDAVKQVNEKQIGAAARGGTDAPK